jgi:hypothetical protein
MILNEESRIFELQETQLNISSLPKTDTNINTPVKPLQVASEGIENASSETPNIDTKALDFEISELEASIEELDSDITSRKTIAKTPKTQLINRNLKIEREKEIYSYSSKLRLSRAH